MCYMFGRGLEAVDYEARGEGCGQRISAKSLESAASQSSIMSSKSLWTNRQVHIARDYNHQLMRIISHELMMPP